MHSPKFPTKALHLKKIISSAALRSLWKKSVRNQMRAQILPDPVEYLDFHINIRQRTDEIENLISSGQYVPKRITRLKFEKSKGLCRQIVLAAPEDALVLQALSDSLWQIIENKAPSKNSFYAPQDQPFAKIQIEEDEDEWGYGPIESWLDFQRTILKFSTKRKFIVVTDIANYYDFILHSFLRAILSDYAGEREHCLDLLLYIIDSMLWRPDYMPNYGIGMPQMNLDAPRLLAHTHLFEIDGIFSQDPDVDFARYMDDMDFGVDSIAKAKTVLRDLDLALQTRNLRLNSGKTKILTAVEAQMHFRVKDNLLVDRLVEKLNFANPSIRLFWIRAISRLIDSGIRKNYFEYGNGSKILKRLIGIINKERYELSDDTFRIILYNQPSLRENILKNWASCPDHLEKIRILAGFLRSGEAVDDVSAVHIATYFVQCRHPQHIKQSSFNYLLNSFSKSDPYGLFCRLWITSRYSTITDLKAEIDSTNDLWSRHAFLCRFVAGFSGLFRGTSHFDAFTAFTRRWSGVEGSTVLDFHEHIATTESGYHSVRLFLEAENSTMPNGTTHAKSLILASALNNTGISKYNRALLLGKRAHMMGDIYYQKLFSRIISQ